MEVSNKEKIPYTLQYKENVFQPYSCLFSNSFSNEQVCKRSQSTIDLFTIIIINYTNLFITYAAKAQAVEFIASRKALLPKEPPQRLQETWILK